MNIDDKYSGLIHISEISSGFVKSINDYVAIGDKIFCKVLEIDEDNKQLKLSIKDINYKTDGSEKLESQIKKGFKPLKDNLPIWTEEKLKEYNQ